MKNSQNLILNKEASRLYAEMLWWHMLSSCHPHCPQVITIIPKPPRSSPRSSPVSGMMGTMWEWWGWHWVWSSLRSSPVSGDGRDDIGMMGTTQGWHMSSPGHPWCCSWCHPHKVSWDFAVLVASPDHFHIVPRSSPVRFHQKGFSV